MKKILGIILICMCFIVSSCNLQKEDKVIIDSIYQEPSKAINYEESFNKAKKSVCFFYDTSNKKSDLKEWSGICVDKVINGDENTYYILTVSNLSNLETVEIYYENYYYTNDEAYYQNESGFQISTDKSNNLSLVYFTTKEDNGLEPVTFSTSNLSKGNDSFVVTTTLNQYIGEDNNLHTNFIPHLNKGIISYLSDTRISTDAPTNSLSLGSGIFDQNGDLCGLITSEETVDNKTSPSDYYEGICSAIKASALMSIFEQLKSYKSITRPTLGIMVAMVDQTLLDESDVNITLPDDNFYCYVSNVVIPGNANNAKVLANDIIISINDINITSLNTISSILMVSIPGDSLNVKIGRMSAGEFKTINLTIILR